jgi:hypothetical protein
LKLNATHRQPAVTNAYSSHNLKRTGVASRCFFALIKSILSLDDRASL